MKWNETININCNINKVFELMDLNNEHTRKILMPNVISHTPLHLCDEVIGSVYKQEYIEGKKVQTYNVKITDYLDSAEKKISSFEFTLEKFAKIQGVYTLVKIDENNTELNYSGSSIGTNFAFKALIYLFSILSFRKNEALKYITNVKVLAEQN